MTLRTPYRKLLATPLVLPDIECILEEFSLGQVWSCQSWVAKIPFLRHYLKLEVAHCDRCLYSSMQYIEIWVLHDLARDLERQTLDAWYWRACEPCSPTV